MIPPVNVTVRGGRGGKAPAKPPPNKPARPSDAVATVSIISGNCITFMFNQRITGQAGTARVPAITADDCRAVSVGAISATSIEVCFDCPITVGMLITWPQLDPAVRTPAGGYVQGTRLVVI